MVSTVQCRHDVASSFIDNIFSTVLFDLFGIESRFCDEDSVHSNAAMSSYEYLYTGEQHMSVDSLKSGVDDATFDASTIQSAKAGMVDSYMDLPEYGADGGDGLVSARSNSSCGSATRSSFQAEVESGKEVLNDERVASPMIIQTGNGPNDSDDDEEEEASEAKRNVTLDDEIAKKDSFRANSTHSSCDEDSASSSDGSRTREGSGSNDDSSNADSSDSDSDSNNSHSSSRSKDLKIVPHRKILSSEQKDSMYTGLNESLQDALLQLATQLNAHRQNMEERGSDAFAADDDTSSENGDDTSAATTSTGNDSIYKNSALVLVRVLLSVAVDRVANAKLPYGVDLFDGADSKTKGSSSKGKRRKARRKGMHKDTAPAADVVQAYVRPLRSQKREGLMFKRASLGAEGGGKMVITGGTSGDYSVASDTSALGRTQVKPKNMTLVLHSLLSVKPAAEENASTRQVVMALSSKEMNPCVMASVSFSKWKTACLACDRMSVSRSAMCSDASAIDNFIWSKLDDNIADWDGCVLRNYQVCVFHLQNMIFLL